MMPLFQIKDKILDPIREKPFKLELEVQEITEMNLQIIFRLNLIRSEFSINNFRIDTLAFDSETNSFVIIEYKRDRNFSVIDQGYAYLSLMLNNKADFILEYNENKKEALKRSSVDWSQSKVVFISPSFTAYQKEAINFKDLPIELWEVKRFGNNTLSFEQIKNLGAQESIKTISRTDKFIKSVTKEIMVYTEQEHLAKASGEIRELYKKYREAILNLGDIEIKPKKLYLAFVAGTNVVDINLQKKKFKLWINMPKGSLDDPKGLMRDVSSTGHWGSGDYELGLSSDEHLEYILSLVKQSYKMNSH